MSDSFIENLELKERNEKKNWGSAEKSHANSLNEMELMNNMNMYIYYIQQ